MYNNFGQPVPGPGYQNPYLERLMTMQPGMPQQAPQAVNLPRCEIIHVNGENGARAFRMAPNSQCLLLDDTAPLVWLCVSDGAGYHTVNPYSISPYNPEPVAPVPLPGPDITALEARISKLEAKMNESHSTDAKPANSRKSKPAEHAPADE